MRKFCNIKLTFNVATKIVAATLDVTDVLLADRVNRKNPIQKVILRYFMVNHHTSWPDINQFKS